MNYKFKPGAPVKAKIGYHVKTIHQYTFVRYDLYYDYGIVCLLKKSGFHVLHWAKIGKTWINNDATHN